MLLHAFHSEPIKEVLDSHSLASPPPLLRVPGPATSMSQIDRELLASQIANVLTRRPSDPLPARDYDIAVRFLQASAELDPDNALWPQILAGVKLRAGERKAAAEDWTRAAALTRWELGGPQQVGSLWTRLGLAEGRILAWQGLTAIQYRPNGVQFLLARTGEILARSGDVKMQLLTLANFDLVREGSRSLEGAMRVSDAALRITGLTKASGEAESPALRERQYIRFETKIREALGPEASESALVFMRRNDAWLALLRPGEEIREESQKLAVAAVLTGATPSALFWAGVLFAALAFFAAALAHAVSNIPHPRPMYLVASGTLAAVVCLAYGTPTLVAAWYFLLGILLSIPSPIGRPEPVEWNALNNLTLGLIAILCIGILGFWILSISPSSQLFSDVSMITERLASQPQTWLELFLGVLSLSIPCAVIWARLKQRSSLSVASQSLARIGTFGAWICMVSTVVATPLCLWLDLRLLEPVNARVLNEPLANRIAQR